MRKKESGADSIPKRDEEGVKKIARGRARSVPGVWLWWNVCLGFGVTEDPRQRSGTRPHCSLVSLWRWGPYLCGPHLAGQPAEYISRFIGAVQVCDPSQLGSGGQGQKKT